MNALLLTTLMVVSGTQQVASEARTARAQSAELALIDEASVAAASPGVLTEIAVKEGNMVQSGATIAQLDDREAQGKLRLAIFEVRAAEEEASNDAKVREAEKTRDVMVQELAQAQATRARAPQSVSEQEVRRLELQVERYGIAAEVARKDLAVAAITRDAKQAAVDLAQLELDKLKIASPLDGHVVQVYKHRGEWVSPGDPIARVIRLDKLRVEGQFSSELYTAQDLAGRPVTVEVRLPGDRVVQLEGQVTNVNPEVDLAGDFQVWAEVENRQENGHWLLGPGRKAEMTVHLK